MQLYVAEGDGRRCVVSLESTHGLRWIVPQGALLPLDRGSAGRVLQGDDIAESVEEREPGVASVSAAVRDRRGRRRGGQPQWPGRAVESPATPTIRPSGQRRRRSGDSEARLFVMQREITGFRQDELGDWVAELECRHAQHVRHRPPFTPRQWVETASGRAENIGQRLDCPLCDRAELPDGLVVAAHGRPIRRDHVAGGSPARPSSRRRNVGATAGTDRLGTLHDGDRASDRGRPAGGRPAADPARHLARCHAECWLDRGGLPCRSGQVIAGNSAHSARSLL